jgi:hypothetical protein
MNMSPSIRDLVAGGDWACAHAQHGTLEAVARSLTALLDGDELKLAREVAQQACSELSIASRAWGQLASLLRAQMVRPQHA